jgi:hypothetical protein
MHLKIHHETRLYLLSLFQIILTYSIYCIQYTAIILLLLFFFHVISIYSVSVYFVLCGLFYPYK